MASADCRHCSTEQLIDLAIASAHPRLRERCDRAKVLAVLEDKHAAYDTHGLHSLLVRKYDTVDGGHVRRGRGGQNFLRLRAQC